ncbi:MAG TPA: hypothetical protein ENL43_04225 [candidate division WOR-3 bacterium]|uniref:M23ase beta-sheet core domain-containing protein n=2 Tax=candidate division WOR-3 bacterium TaxID=2052148 RepID=A0A7V5LUX7_UNCW3|nr:hypothetical protein [candidate division WOR-3 bacterium]
MKYLFLLMLLTTGNIETYRRRLEKLKKDLENRKKTIQLLEKKRKSITSELTYLNEREKAILSFLRTIREKKNILSRDIKALDLEIEKLEVELKRRIDALKFGLVFLYETPPRHPFEKILVMDTKDLELLFVTDHIIQFEKKEHAKTLREYEKLQKFKRLKEDNLAFVMELQDEADIKKKELVKLRKEKEKLLYALERKKEREEKKMKELQKAIHDLESLLARLEREQEAKRRREGIQARSPTGKYPWPCRGKIKRRFGTIINPKYKTKIINPGIDIETTPNTPVISIDQGKVIYASSLTGWGKTVIIDHGGFLSVYSHLGRISVNLQQRVKQGDIIGYSGDYDSYFGTVVHFELRNRGKAIDPLKYLK